MRIIVTSKNPIKINSTKNAFEKVFPNEKIEIVTLGVPSNVRNNPIGDIEMREGAHNRIQNAMEIDNSCDYYVGLEGGTEVYKDAMVAFAWVVVKTKDGRVGEGRTGSFILPKVLCEYISKGTELGDACDIVFGKENHKQKSGTVSILTKEIVDITSLYEQAVIFALIPFINKELY